MTLRAIDRPVLLRGSLLIGGLPCKRVLMWNLMSGYEKLKRSSCMSLAANAPLSCARTASVQSALLLAPLPTPSPPPFKNGQQRSLQGPHPGVCRRRFSSSSRPSRSLSLYTWERTPTFLNRGLLTFSPEREVLPGRLSSMGLRGCSRLRSKEVLIKI